jgi:hypothetical protein
MQELHFYHRHHLSVADSKLEDGTMRPSDEPTDGQTTEAATAVQGGLAYWADVERRPAPFFARAEPNRRAMV